MRSFWVFFYTIILLAGTECTDNKGEKIDQHSISGTNELFSNDTLVVKESDTLNPEMKGPLSINTSNTQPQELVEYAKSLTGIPYQYGSADPQNGFDCSGFITYVFHHFNIAVPRSSVEFTHAGDEIPISSAKPGDLILFTGTDSSVRIVGHMGIITAAENNEIQFIHSTSGKAWGVTVTPLNNYYKGRFVKVIRVFAKI